MPRTSFTGSFVVLAAVLCACGGEKSSDSSSQKPKEERRADEGAKTSDGEASDPGTAETGAAGRKSDSGAGGSGGSAPTKPAADSGKGGDEPAKRDLTGETDFDSADVNTGRASGGPARGGAAGSSADSATTAPPAATSPSGQDGARARAVERGDIYRVLGDGRILNLNAYRGLQVIDVRDVNAPKIEGRLAVSGSPLEMYVVGERAIVLLNEWRGYYASGDDVNVEGVQSGIVLNVDIRDRAQPKLLSQAVMNGNIRTSRLTQGDGQSALYVAASNYTGNATTLIKSFDVSGDAIAPKSEIDLGGYVQDVQATTDLMLVSSIDYSRTTTTQTQQGSQVALIDISRPDGTMVRGGSVQARGVVENKFNMDAYNGVLRVVSGATWSGTRENHLETFSLANLGQPRALAHCTFGSGESLFATVFIENKGFFVTYLRQDPFHAFSIDDQGRCAEHNQYIVSGWNDFLRPTLGGTRLIGVGSNDTNFRRTVSVSLYDTTNIDNPRPMLARVDLSLDSSYSEAQWDDRAFAVLEDAVDVAASDGTRETGLVLVPFQGYDPTKQQYIAQVQILTFSQRTLTRRGVMDHGSAVRRTFLASESTAANLSDEELRLFEIGDPSKPQARGKVEVAPNYRQVFVFGEHVARVHDPSFYFAWNGNPNVTPPAAIVEVVPRSADPDLAEPIARIAVPSNSTLTQVGKLLVSVLTQPDNSVQKPQPAYKTQIQVYDFSDPTQPKQGGVLETDRIQPYYFWGFYPAADVARPPVVGDCFDCYPRPRGGSQQYVAGDALVFVSLKTQQKSLGTVHRCYEYPTASTGCTPRMPVCSTYYTGSKSCVTYKDGREECSGEFYECDGNTCAVTDKDLPTTKSCVDQEEFRYWTSYAFDPLDLRKADQPVLAKQLAMDEADEGSSLLAVGSALYFNYQRPQPGATGQRPSAKRYFQRIDFADPQAPAVTAAVNVPGDVIAADGDTIYTRDQVWKDQSTVTRVARLIVDKDLAYLQANRLFSDRTVYATKLDGAGHMLVSNAASYGGNPGGSSTAPKTMLSILDAKSLELQSDVEIASWANFVDASAGRALYSVSGGLLVFNVEDAAKPFAQAYFPTVTWPDAIYFDGNEAMFAGGPYGVYKFDTKVFNLMKK